MTATQPAPVFTHPPPSPRPGSDAERQAIASCLARGSFSEGVVCARLSIRDYSGLEKETPATLHPRLEGHDPSTLLIRLFVVGGALTEEQLASVMSDTERAAFVSTGLLTATGGGTAQQWYCPVQLVPLADRYSDLVIACDRRTMPDGTDLDLLSDIVFSGHNPLTLQFLRLLPTTNTGTVLDLCSGTGVAALAAASTALRVAAVDVTERSTAFARFNAWVNDLSHVDVRCGDLYEPIGDERFDRIVAHPPYVPTLTESAVYRDGGHTGDRLVRHIIQELPDHLNPGGTFHMLSAGIDTETAPFEMRVREWLGVASSEFDIAFGVVELRSIEMVARMLSAKATVVSRESDFERWMQLFADVKAREFVYGATVARRNAASAGDPQTRRLLMPSAPGPEAFDWLFKWFDWLRLPNRRQRVLELKPSLAPDMQVEVVHVVRDGHFSPDRFRLENGGTPFRVHLQTDGWIVSLLDQFDGAKSAAEVYGVARMARQLPEHFAENDFLDLVCLMIERGFLRAAEAAVT
jgi:methylase of polypeptide subunit release factors